MSSSINLRIQPQTNTENTDFLVKYLTFVRVRPGRCTQRQSSVVKLKTRSSAQEKISSSPPFFDFVVNFFQNYRSVQWIFEVEKVNAVALRECFCPLTFRAWNIKIEQGEILGMPKIVFRAVFCLLFGFCVIMVSVSQDNSAGEEAMSRVSIPEELLRPQRGEAPRYPVDTVIGPLGRGEASGEAYLFARKVSAALLAGNQNDSSLQGMNSVSREAFISELNTISPQVYRLGSGREEPDGAVSFLVRFLGRERGITGELYIRPQNFDPPADTPPPETVQAGTLEDAEPAGEPEPAGELPPLDDTAVAAGESGEAGQTEETESAAATGPEENQSFTGPVVWIFEDLILEEARERETENPQPRFDFPPYERFF
jgi:hypothetical protein